jgi:hypothetical protein
VQEEKDVAVDEEENLLIMAPLLRLRVRINAPPQQEGSRPGKKKNKGWKVMSCLSRITLLTMQYIYLWSFSSASG